MGFKTESEVYKGFHISYIIYSTGKTEATVASREKRWSRASPGQKLYEPIYNFSMKSKESAQRHAHNLVDAYIKQNELPQNVGKFIK